MRAVRSKRVSERGMRTSEWPSSLRVDFIVILPTVRRLPDPRRLSPRPLTMLPVPGEPERLYGDFPRSDDIIENLYERNVRRGEIVTNVQRKENCEKTDKRRDLQLHIMMYL